MQNNKQVISSLKRKTSEGIDELRASLEKDQPTSRITARWSNDELLLAVQGVRKYGKDFKTIAETIGTKTEQHLRAFFVNYRRRYNLDTVLKEYEKENGPISNSPEDSLDSEKMEIDIDASENNSDITEVSPTTNNKVPVKSTGKVAVSAGQANK